MSVGHGRRIWRLVRAGLAVIVVLMLIGATCQGVITALERRDFPRPGALVDSGTHQLHINCTGRGLPTVVLEAPAMGMSSAWADVQTQVAKVTRVCSYDRSGLGWSEWGGRDFDPARVPVELHVLLQRARETGPFVLAGEGLGAAFVRLYASSFPNDTRALVLIDDVMAGANQVIKSPPIGSAGVAAALPWLARIGLLRADQRLHTGLVALPSVPSGAMRAFLNRPDHLTRAGQEIDRWADTIALARDARIPAGVAVIPVGSGSDARFLVDPSAVSVASRAIIDAARTAGPPRATLPVAARAHTR